MRQFLLAISLLLSSLSVHAQSEFVTIDGRQYRQAGDMLILDEPSVLRFDANKDKWTDGKVFYEFAPDVSELNRQRFVEAYQEWEAVADLEFIERTDQANYIYVQNDDRNYAIVGMVGGRQILSMNNWSYKYIIVHEIGHSLGMWHEHMRSDRDNYVTIIEENIESDQRYNFTQRQTTDYSEYDFMSVMHYRLDAYTVNGQRTIEPLPEFSDIAEFAGQRDYISGGDQVSVASQYGAKVLSFTDINFEAFLVNNFDTNGDSTIDSLEAANVESITTPGLGNITSIDGIEHFRYLRYLDLSNENLNSLPALPSRLENLIVRNNQLSNVDFSWQEPPLLQSLDISGNLFDVYQCDNLIALQLAFTEGEFVFSPSQNGEPLICDETTRNMLVNGKAKEDLRSKQPRVYFIDVPAGQTLLTLETERFGELDGGLMDMYVAFDFTPTTSEFDYSSTNANNEESIGIVNPSEGRWYVALIPNERSFENVSLTATYSTGTIDDRLLLNSQSKTGLSAGETNALNFYIDIPENAQNLVIDIEGGSGDADLYVRAGTAPTLNTYDCRPYLSGNTETCTFAEPVQSRYYISLVAYRDFSNVSLTARYDIVEPTPGGSASRENLSNPARQWQFFRVDIPEGMNEFTISTSGGRGDADLYVNFGAQPTANSYACRPYRDGNNETCSISTPSAGSWYIGLYGYTSFDGVRLDAVWN